MSKPSVFHAGCYGTVEPQMVNGQKRLVCLGCARWISDPMELMPRGPGKFEKVQDDTRVDAVQQ